MQKDADMEMNYCETPWILSEEECPCDLDFVQYLGSKKVKDKLIFHFGTGEHHLVGKANHERGNLNEIIGITASKEECTAYIDFAIKNPVAANYYKVWFADIYTLSARMLPSFDIVTLFHLGESYDFQAAYDIESYRFNSAYARLNDVTLLEMFLSRLTPGGKIIFYTGSYAFEEPFKAAEIVNEFVHNGRMVVEEDYKNLRICTLP
jgi:hypothetical protein